MELLKIKDIMRLYGVGRPTATAWTEASGAAMPRPKGGTYHVNKEKFENWLRRRTS